MTAPGKNENWLRVLVIALCVRVGYFLLYLHSACNGFLLADDIYYREWALRIRDGDWLGQGPFEQGPLYAYLLAIELLAGLPEPAILFLQALTGVAVCVLVYLCGRRLFSERVATAGAILTALYGPLLYYECMFMKSFLSPLFVTLTLYFGLRYAEALQLRWACLAGATVGLACLVRESYALLLLPMALWVWAHVTVRQGSPYRRVGHVLALAASFAAALLPSAVRNSLVAGEFVLVTTGGGEVMYIAHGPEADGYWHWRAVPVTKMNPRQEHQAYRDEAQRRTGRQLTAAESSSFWYGEAFRAIKANPGRFLLLTAKRAVILLNSLEVPDSSDYQVWREFIPALWLLPNFGWIVAFGLLGICACAADWKRYGLAIGLIAMIVLGVLLTYNFGRFRLGMMPLWALFAAAGFARWLSWWREGSRRGRILAAASGVACLAVTTLSFLPPPGAEVVYSSAVQEYWRKQVTDRQEARQTAAELQTVANPNWEVHSQLGRQLMKAGRWYEGIREHRLAVKQAPGNAHIRVVFSQDLMQAGYESESMDQVKDAMRVDPAYGSAAANNMLVHMLHKRPDLIHKYTQRLIELGEQMCQVTSRENPALLCTLAAVYAKVGRVEEAIGTAEQGLAVASKGADATVTASLQRLLELCRQHQRQAQKE